MPDPDVHMSGPEATSSNSSKRKRQREPNAEPGTSSPASAKKARTTSSKQPKKGRKGWAIPLSEIPVKARGLQRAFHLHIHILWRLFTQNGVPPAVAGALINNFQERFKSSDHVQSFVDNLVSAVNPASAAALAAVKEVQRTAHIGTSQIAKDAKRMEESHLLTMFNAVANAGLNRWAPDVLGAVESMYNASHELLAISTFKTIAASFGYTFMNADLSFLQNHSFLVKLYRSFVFGYMAEKARKEGKTPGRVAKDSELMNVYRRHDHLRETQVKQLQDDGFSKAVVRLAQENEAHSDDELDPNSPPNQEQYLIRPKEGRSVLVTEMFRFADERYKKALQRRTGTRIDRLRVVPDVPIDESRIVRFPTNVPIDYFDPDYFNEMTVRERAKYMDNGVALPKPELCEDWASIMTWKNLPKKEFMKKYGEETLARYNIPTEAELAQLEQHDADDSDEDEDSE